MGGEKLKEKIAFHVLVLRHLMPFEIQATSIGVHKGTRLKEMQKMLDRGILHFVHEIVVRNKLTDSYWKKMKEDFSVVCILFARHMSVFPLSFVKLPFDVLPREYCSIEIARKSRCRPFN